MPDITHIEWAGFAGVGRLEWLGRRYVREEGGGVIVVVARESRSGSRFDSRIKV